MAIIASRALAGAVAGFVSGGALDIAAQLALNGGRFECVDWGRVGTAAALSGATGALTGGISGWLGRGVAAGSPSASGASSASQGALLRAQLAAEEIAGARLPHALTGYTKHGLNQAISRDGVGVSTRAIHEAFHRPLGITGQTGGRFVLVGRNATVVINGEGKLISTWATGSAGIRIRP